MMSNLSLLISIGSQMLGLAFLFLYQKVFKVTRVSEKLTVTDFENTRADGVEEGPVVGNGKDRAGKLLNLRLEPTQGFEI